MARWLSHEMAQGLAFNAGSNFDPPKEVKGYYLQPDLSLGVGRMPLDKRDFPILHTPQLSGDAGANLFPNSVLFPNLAMHLRMGLPWRGDAYVRFADATTPAGYKISPTMTAQVQTNSYGGGIRQHFFGGDRPTLTLGAHYNHVQGRTRLKSAFTFQAPGVTQTDDFTGDIRWSINSFGTTAIVSKSFGAWTPFAGIGYNYATGSVSTSFDLSASAVNSQAFGVGSERPEKNQGREIFGLSYDRPTWSLFANGELKAIGQLQYRSIIVQFGGALPFDIGRGPAIFYKRKSSPAAAQKTARDEVSTPDPERDDAPPPVRKPAAKARKADAPPLEPGPAGLILWK